MTSAASPPGTTVSGGDGPVAEDMAPGRTEGAAAAPAVEACPLCGAPLGRDQEWCLHCGAAARTRLATSSNWKAPVISVAVIALLSLGVLAASLVALAGNSGPKTVSIVRTVTTAPTALAPTTTTPAPSTPGAGTPGAGTPTASTPATAPGATTPGATATPTTPGASNPPSAAVTPYLRKLEARERTSKSPAEKKKIRELEERIGVVK